MARIAVGGFQHETNTFAPSKADLAAFEAGGAWPALVSGPDLPGAVAGMNLSVTGFIDAITNAGHDIVPTTWCAASPSAHVTEHAFETVSRKILDGIRSARQIDAVYLCLHGAMVTEHLDDGEGELLRRVRQLIGPSIPLVASLDFHANITPLMVDASDGIVGYRTYPHVDMAVTGARTAQLLGAILGSVVPSSARRALDFLIPLNWQCTTLEPNVSLYRRLSELEADPEILSLTFAPGFPAADIPGCRPTVIGYGRTQATVDRAVTELANAAAAAEADFAGTIYSPEEGVREAQRLAATASRPIVLADTQDNPGAGGDSDTTGMLRALIAADAQNAALGLMADGEAALAAHQAGIGAEITLPLGGRSGIPGDAPFDGTFVVEALGDGRFDGTGPMYQGARMDLGPMARVKIRDIQIVIATRKAQLADRSMLRHVGIEPADKRILVNKSSVHFRADFEPIAEAILVCAAPGPMVADSAALPWTRLDPNVRTSPLGRPMRG